MHSRTVTQIRRFNRYAIGDVALRSRMVKEFQDPDGVKRLAWVLGTSRGKAAAVLAGRDPVDMHRLAFYYGFMPDGDDPASWRILPMDEEPFDSGPPMRWSGRMVDYLRSVLNGGPSAPDPRSLAWRMDTTVRRLQVVLRKHRIATS